ncbi:MAG TPA: DUF4403 family protein [Longimicrobiaceae bacterium]|nr:DUF4403 family protein [Longimicrobiaceae bacterium]
MKRSSSRATLAFALLLVSACGTRVDVAPPETGAASRTIPEPEPSTVHLPVTLSLGPLAEQVDELAPRGDDNEAEWHELGRFYVKEKWERGPLRVSLGDNWVEVRTQVSYRARMAARACVPVAGCRFVQLASCGHGGPMPTLDVGLRTTLRWREDWTLVPHTTAAPVQAGVRCRLTEARIDVTERVQQAAQNALAGLTPQVDARLREAVALRRRVEPVWAALQNPVKAADGVYLLLRPESVSVAPLRASGTDLSTTVSLTVRPRVVVGERPEPSVLPLPNFGSVVGRERGFRIAVVAEVPYAAANELLRGALVGRRLTVRGHKIRVKDVRMSGGGDRVVVAVKLAGDARGTVYFVGTPAYDAATQTLTVPDLDFSVETRNVLAGAAGWLLHDDLRGQLRTAARFGIGPRVSALRAQLDTAINRNLATGVEMRGGVDALRPLGVTVSATSVGAVVVADGHAQIEVTVR